MQLLSQEYPSVGILAESVEDLWYLEKIIDPGDFVSSTSQRRFKTEAGDTERKKVWIKLRVEKVEFHRFSNVLRVLGTIVEGRPEDLVSLGSHHTLEIRPGTRFTLEKQKWLSYHREMLSRAVKASKRPRFVLVAMDEDQASIYSLGEIGLEFIAEIDRRGGGKWAEVQEGVRQEYFHSLAKALLEREGQLVVGGPGFAKDDFYQFCKEKYPKLAERMIVVNLASSGRAGINEILARNEISKALEEARLSQETKLVNALMAEIGKDGLVVYGPDKVKEALDYGAVDKLLITEDFFLAHRENCEELMKKAEETRAEIHVIGRDHDPGRQLKALGGIAALLRFRID